MSRYRTQGLLALGFGLAAAGCADPVLSTDLRPAGPPDVLAVVTQNPLDLAETAVKCKYVGGKRDPKGPGFIGDPITGGGIVCPEVESEFAAARLEPRNNGTAWAVRVMFDELLDADRVETLDCIDDPIMGRLCNGSFEDTQPVKLTCGATNTEVGYTGYYIPNGNNTTFPLGPSLYIAPNADEMVFATGSSCTLTLDSVRVTDKEGIAAPADDLATPLKIDDLKLIAIDPEPSAEPATISPDPVAAGAAAFVFNASLDDAETDPAMFELKDSAGAVQPTGIFVGGYNDGALTDGVYVFPDTATGIFGPGAFSATMKPGELTEINGGKLTVAADQITRFNVAFGKTGQTLGTDLATNAIIRISFNSTLDPASIGPEDLEMFTSSVPGNPQVAITTVVGNSTAALANVANNAIIITPTTELPIGTHIVRIKAGAEIKDTAAMPNLAKFAAPLALTYAVLLKITHTLPATGGTLPLANNFDIIFSGSLDFTTVGAAEFELTDLSNMMPVPMTIEMGTSTSRPLPSAQSHANDTVRINPNANLVAGRMYRVTMKPGTQLKSANGISRTFATATSWTFTAN